VTTPRPTHSRRPAGGCTVVMWGRPAVGPQLIAGRGCRPPRGEGPDPGRPGRRSGGPTSLGGHPPRPAPRRAWGAHGVAASGVFHHDGRGRSGAGGGVLGG